MENNEGAKGVEKRKRADDPDGREKPSPAKPSASPKKAAASGSMSSMQSQTNLFGDATAEPPRSTFAEAMQYGATAAEKKTSPQRQTIEQFYAQGQAAQITPIIRTSGSSALHAHPSNVTATATIGQLGQATTKFPIRKRNASFRVIYCDSAHNSEAEANGVEVPCVVVTESLLANPVAAPPGIPSDGLLHPYYEADFNTFQGQDAPNRAVNDLALAPNGISQGHMAHAHSTFGGAGSLFGNVVESSGGRSYSQDFGGTPHQRDQQQRAGQNNFPEPFNLVTSTYSVGHSSRYALSSPDRSLGFVSVFGNPPAPGLPATGTAYPLRTPGQAQFGDMGNGKFILPTLAAPPLSRFATYNALIRYQDRQQYRYSKAALPTNIGATGYPNLTTSNQFLFDNESQSQQQPIGGTAVRQPDYNEAETNPFIQMMLAKEAERIGPQPVKELLTFIDGDVYDINVCHCNNCTHIAEEARRIHELMIQVIEFDTMPSVFMFPRKPDHNLAKPVVVMNEVLRLNSSHMSGDVPVEQAELPVYEGEYRGRAREYNIYDFAGPPANMLHQGDTAYDIDYAYQRNILHRIIYLGSQIKTWNVDRQGRSMDGDNWLTVLRAIGLLNGLIPCKIDCTEISTYGLQNTREAAHRYTGKFKLGICQDRWPQRFGPAAKSIVIIEKQKSKKAIEREKAKRAAAEAERAEARELAQAAASFGVVLGDEDRALLEDKQDEAQDDEEGQQDDVDDEFL